ncbi:hypothetical protein PCE1_001065 [Barthelona sp. PCE]
MPEHVQVPRFVIDRIEQMTNDIIEGDFFKQMDENDQKIMKDRVKAFRNQCIYAIANNEDISFIDEPTRALDSFNTRIMDINQELLSLLSNKGAPGGVPDAPTNVQIRMPDLMEVNEAIVKRIPSLDVEIMEDVYF